MSFWTLDRIADALGESNAPRGTRVLRGVTTDTRAVEQGDAFVALRGERFDAHDFLGEAVSKGAAALVVADVSRAARTGVPVFAVGDTLSALGALGRYRRRAWGKPVIAIAGSNGKTSTKELLRAALASTLEVHATRGNLNNQVGVPLTLLALPDDADVAVVEVGTNYPGEVAILRAVVQPDVALITSIGEEHLEGFGDLAGVLREEMSICDGVSLAIVPASQPEVVEAARSRATHVVAAGLDAGDFHPDRWGMEPDGSGWLAFGDVTVRPPLRGEHNLRNTVLSLAAATQCGVSLADAARGIALLTPPPMRTAWHTVGALTVINDAYNANPASAREVIRMLDRLDTTKQRVLILGTMRELGARAPELHEEIARLALGTRSDVIAGIGDFAPALASLGAGDARVVVAPDVDELWPLLSPRLASDAVVALKASRGVRLERLVPYLTTFAES